MLEILMDLTGGRDTMTEEESSDESEEEDVHDRPPRLADNVWWRLVVKVAMQLANGQEVISMADVLRQSEVPQELDMRSCMDVFFAARAVEDDEVKALTFAGKHLCRLIAKYSAEYADPEQTLLVAEESVKTLRGNLLCCATNCRDYNESVRCGISLARHRTHHRSNI